MFDSYTLSGAPQASPCCPSLTGYLFSHIFLVDLGPVVAEIGSRWENLEEALLSDLLDQLLLLAYSCSLGRLPLYLDCHLLLSSRFEYQTIVLLEHS